MLKKIKLNKSFISFLLAINIFFISCFTLNVTDDSHVSYAAISTGVVVTAAIASGIIGMFAYNFLSKTKAVSDTNQSFEEWAREKKNVDFVANIAKVQAIADVVGHKKVKDGVVDFSSSDLQIINSSLKTHFNDIVTGNNLKSVPNDEFLSGNVNDFINISEHISSLYPNSKVNVYLEPTEETYFVTRITPDTVSDFGSYSYSTQGSLDKPFPLRRLNIGYVVTGDINVDEQFSYFINSNGLIGFNDYLGNEDMQYVRVGSYVNASKSGKIHGIYEDRTTFAKVPFPSLLSSLSYLGTNTLTWENFFQNTTKTSYSKILDKTSAISTPSRFEIDMDKIKESTANISVSLDTIGADTKKGVGFLGKILDAVGSILGALGGWFSKVFEKLGSLDIISSVLTAILSAFNWVKDFLTTMIDGILAGIKTIFKWAFDFSNFDLLDFPNIAWLTSIFMFVINLLKLLLTYEPNSPIFSFKIPWWGKQKTFSFKVDEFFDHLKYNKVALIELIRYLNDFALCLLIGFKFTRLIGGDD